MIGFSNQKGRDIRKPVPGCMGRMINLFDLISGLSETKLLTDKHHRDGFQITRDCIDDVLEESDSAVIAVQEKAAAHLPRYLSTNNRANGTPMKMLMAEELSKEREVVCKQPTVIAKLMGIDALPTPQSVQPVKRTRQDRGLYLHYNGQKSAPPCQQQEIKFSERTVVLPKQQQHSRHTQGRGVCNGDDSVKLAPPCQQLELSFSERPVVFPKQDQPSPHHHIHENRVCKDVYEIRPQIPRTNDLEYSSQYQGKLDYNIHNERMALVRQKSTEAKLLATSQNLLQSKEFQDALEVLRSNSDVFLEFLKEPDSILSQHPRGQQHAQNTTMNGGKRITVLRPMTRTSTNAVRQDHRMKSDLIHETNRRIKNSDSFQRSGAGIQNPGYLPQPTRIVVLKPSPGKNCNERKETSIPSTTIGVPKEPVPDEGVGNNKEGVREVAAEITRRMRESLSRRDETLLSHILSTVTTEEDDSFSRSGKEHVEEEGVCTCSSTAQDPSTASHNNSWKHCEASGSPCSFSSRRLCQYLPESSVIIEAKRRLSERWVLVTSGGVNQEPQEIQRSSSTLGEMLSIREAKRKEDSRYGRFGRKNRDDCTLSNCDMNPLRSRSVPQPCSGGEVDSNSTVVNVRSVNNHVIDGAVEKTKHYETSFKGKVSNLLLSWNSKTSNTDKSLPHSPYSDHLSHGRFTQSGNSHVTTAKSDHSPLQCSVDESPNEGPIYNYEELLRKNLYSANSDSDLGTPASKKECLLDKLMASEYANDNNMEQPSPVSVLQPQFEDDAISGISSSFPHVDEKQERHCASPRCISTEPVACSLTWDDDGDGIQECTHQFNPLAVSNLTEEEQYLTFARLLLLSSSLGDGTSVSTIRWHSLDSPLDPALLEKHLEPKEEAARSRERRSNQRLLFDCVNAVILELSRSNVLDSCPGPWPVSCPMTVSSGNRGAAISVTEEILSTMRALMSGDREKPPHGSVWGVDNGSSSVVADLIIRKEILGKGWDEEMTKLEVVEMVVEIQVQVIEELVAEALCCWFC